MSSHTGAAANPVRLGRQGWFDAVYPVYAGDRVGANTEQTLGVAVHLRCGQAGHLALLLNREKTVTEHPALAALNPPERQLAATFLQWLATLEDTRTQIKADMAAEGLDIDEVQAQARLRDVIAATRAGLDPGQRRNFDWLFTSLRYHLAATGAAAVERLPGPRPQDLPTSDNCGKTQPLPGRPRRGRQPAPLPGRYAGIHTSYVAELARATMLDDDTRRAYASRVRQYLIWLDTANLDGDPLCEPGARDGAARDYRSYLQTVANRKPSTINTVLAAIGDFYTRRGLGAPDVRRLDLPQAAPRALDPRDVTRWLRAVERWVNPRDRVLALIPFYAGLRLGEVIALDLDDIRLSARKGIVIVRAGKGGAYREVPVHPQLRPDLALWINDERPAWKGSAHTSALLLNHRGVRLGARGADDILGAIADEAHLTDEFTSHVLRHTFGTTLVRQGHDLVLVAELMGHKRLDQTRRYSLPTQADRERAIGSLPSDR